jgi:Pretoxin HINT domain
VMGVAPSAPTGGGQEALAAVSVSQLGSAAATPVGSLTMAAFRSAQAFSEPSIALGSEWSGSALQQQFVAMGSVMVEQYCFPAGTEVLMADGTSKSIEQIQIADRVAAIPHDNVASLEVERLLTVAGGGQSSGQLANGEAPDSLQAGYVSRVYHNPPQRLLNVCIDQQSIATTAGHPFYVPNRGWVTAAELSVGDSLLTAMGREVTVTGLDHDLSPPVPVYNLCVDSLHTYFVRIPGSDEFVLVHNDSFGLYTYGNALLPVIVEGLQNTLQNIVDSTMQLVNSVLSAVESAINVVSDVVNTYIIGAGAALDYLGANQLGQWLVTSGQEGLRENSIFGVDATTIAIAAVSAAITIGTFGVGAGVGILFVGAVAGVSNAYMQAAFNGSQLSFRDAFAGAINGITNPFGATFGVLGGTINVMMNEGLPPNELKQAYNTGFALGQAFGTIVGGMALSGKAALIRSGGSRAYAAWAMAPEAAGGVAGLAYGRMSGMSWTDSAQMAVNVSQLAGLAGALTIKCFVAGTPVWVPVTLQETQVSFAGIVPIASFENWQWQHTVGVGMIITGLVGWIAQDSRSQRIRKRRYDSPNDAAFDEDFLWSQEDPYALEEITISRFERDNR